MQLKATTELSQFSTNMEELRRQLDQLELLDTECAKEKAAAAEQKAAVERHEAEERQASDAAAGELRRKFDGLEKHVLQYKAKAQELKTLKGRLEKLTEENARMDREIAIAQDSLKESKKRVIITSDSEGTVKQLKALVQKNTELQRGLDFYVKHKESLAASYEGVKRRK